MVAGKCDEKFEGEAIWMKGSSYSVEGMSTRKEGYVQYFCYRCEVKPIGGLPSVIFDSDDMYIMQHALSCHKYLKPKSSLTLRVTSFKQSFSITEFFTKNDLDGCTNTE